MRTKIPKIILIVLSILVFLFSVVATTQADPLDVWHFRNSLTQNDYGITYGSNTFVAVGYGGTILTSPDGITWTSQTSGTTNNLLGIAYGNNTFVAVGNSGTILTSPDGTTWTSRILGTSINLRGIIYANNIFVACGASGALLTSPDGTTWTSRISGTTALLFSIAYGYGTFVAVGNYGTIITSPDGIAWTSRTPGTSPNHLYSIAYGNNIFVAVGFGVTLTSSDGSNWSSSGNGYALYGVIYVNNTFVAVGYGGTVLTSPNGTTWTPRTSGTTSDLEGIAYGNSTFVAVGDSGTILNSPDGDTWTSRSSGTSDLYGIAYGNSTFVAVHDLATILTSPDGATWTSRLLGSVWYLNGITYGNSTFVAVGNGGTIVTSPDGITWTFRSSGTPTISLSGITYGNSIFVAVGENGTILTSPDGATWTSRTSGVTNFLYQITYGNSIFVAVGENGTILTSPDGATWTSRTSGITDDLLGIAYGDSTFVAVGGVGTILTSPDGITWTSRTSGTTNWLYGITYGDSTFVAVGGVGTILTSPDGITWTSRTSGATDPLLGITYGNNTFVAVGYNGTILQSDSLSADIDNDGLTNYEESVFGTDPLLWDTDGDGVSDLNDAFPLDPLEITDSDAIEIRITTNSSDQVYPAISGDRIVWQDYRNGNWDVYLYDLSTGTETPITTNFSNQWSPAISGDRIVWQDYRNGNTDIYLYDLSTGTEIPITTNSSDQYNPAISGDRIVWQDYRNGNWDVYLYDLSTGTETQITTNSSDQYNPAISGDRIVWQDDRNGNTDIYLYDLSAGTETQITTNSSDQYNPAISGDRIVWQDDRSGNWEIYMYDLSTWTETQITTISTEAAKLVISGDRIVFDDNRNGNSDIYLYDLSTGTETQITTNSSEQWYPAISGDRIVWHDDRNGNYDIYLYKGDGIGDNSDNCPTVYNPTQVIPTWYRDADGDGYGNPSLSLQACIQPDFFYVANNTDCNDSDPSVNPGATEIPGNGKDDDCNPATPDVPAVDSDGDGVYDASDNCPTVYNPTQVIPTWYRDADSDTFGDPGNTTSACTQPAGYVTNNTDCDDTDASIHPGATEDCDRTDNNCNGTIDEGCPDADGDGITDTIDNCPTVYNPGQTDTDHDSIGDACDNCPSVPNLGQEDTDHDGVGDACDNCRLDFNPSVASWTDKYGIMHYNSQKDTDLNGKGDVCDNGTLFDSPPSGSDPDTDGDGVKDTVDNCPSVRNGSAEAAIQGVGNQTDSDGDLIGDACDPCPDDPNNDADGDGVCVGAHFNSPKIGANDNCPDIFNPDQRKTSASGTSGDACNPDIDSDTYCRPGFEDSAKYPQCYSGTPLTLKPYDCNDNNADIHPLAPETNPNYSGVDYDCDPGTPDNYVVFEVNTPVNYNTWLPTPGNLVMVTAHVHPGVNGASSIPVTYTYRTTNWPGKYTNDISAETNPAGADFTVRFNNNPWLVAGSDNQNSLVSMQLAGPASIELTSNDYGGSITITAQATIDSVLRTATLTLPKDRDGDGLPDIWEDKYGDLNANEDIENISRNEGSTSVGDGLTNFKEYRGFKWGAVKPCCPSPTSEPDCITCTSGVYQTAAFVPALDANNNPLIAHFRTNPKRKDLFVKYTGFDTNYPFAVGAAFWNAGIDIHVINSTQLPTVGDLNIDPLLVTLDTGSYGTGNISWANIRSWSWDTKGAVTTPGDATNYGTGTRAYQTPLNNYFNQKPYINMLPGTVGLDPITATTYVEDVNDNGRKDQSDRVISCGTCRSNTVDGDHLLSATTPFSGTLTTFDIDNDGYVELPFASDPSKLTSGSLDTNEYSRKHVLKHTITHEMGHAAGVTIETSEPDCVMFSSSPNWHRDGNFGPTAKSQLKIHNQ